MNPINLALRFFLEVIALGALGWWAWAQTDSWWRAPLRKLAAHPVGRISLDGFAGRCLV